MEVKVGKRIIRNMIRCKRCGDIIESKSVHDFVRCMCGACFTDGGHDYLRRGWDPKYGGPDDVFETLDLCEDDGEDEDENNNEDNQTHSMCVMQYE